jgi:hypothetical protein
LILLLIFEPEFCGSKSKTIISFVINKAMEEEEKIFTDYLAKKNIHAERFKAEMPEMYAEWKQFFLQTHPKSFTMQKLFQMNEIRRKFILNDKNVSITQ